MEDHPDFWGELSREDRKCIRDIMREHKLDFGFAANVYKKRYSIDEAKRRQYLKNKEKKGQSVDLYACGRRLGGSIGCGKRR